MLIGICGAPGSGKSTLAARLYAELLERGINSSRLVTEYATEWLGQGNKIESFDQRIISITQEDREYYAQFSGFDPIICDSALWMGAVYTELGFSGPPKDLERELVIGLYHRTLNRYDMTIYVPLFDDEGRLNTFRIHNAEQSKQVDAAIVEKLKSVKEVRHAPIFLREREEWIKCMAWDIHNKMDMAA